MRNFIRKWYPLMIILLSAAALRINLLFHRGMFWFDEEFSVHFSSLSSWADTIKYWVLETNPPLFTFFLRFYLPFIDKNNENIVRVPSIVFGLLSITLLYIFAEKLFSRKAAVFSTLFLMLSALHMVISTETRIYSLLVFLTIASCYFFYKIFFENNNTAKIWSGYVIVNLFLIYSHLTVLVIFLIQFLSVSIIKPKKEIKLKWYISQITITVLWLIWFLPSIISKLGAVGTAWFFNNPNTKTFNPEKLLLFPFTNSFDNNFVNTIFFLLFFAGIFALIKFIKESADKKRNILIFISLWAFLPIFFSSLLGVFIPKYIIISYPAIYLLAGFILDKYTANKKIFWATIATIIIIIFPISWQVSKTTVFSWQPFIDYIKNNETDKSIVLFPFSDISLQKHYDGSSPLIGLYTKQDNLSLEERIVRYNWNQINTSEQELQTWLCNQLKQNNNADKIFLIQQFDGESIVHKILLKNNWTMNHKEILVDYYDYYLYEFNESNNQTTSTICLPANK